ncbi:MAG: elongation factor P 5-aminopentanone reductase [Eubacteriales bacterium]|jgi:3-oxoacyl-[acyl-carrier protein] reductase
MSPAVLITGASRGIGAAIAERFAREGWQVGVNFSRSRDEALELCRRLEKWTTVLPLQADVSREEQVQSMMEEAQKALGFVDVLINNAGVAHTGLLQDMTVGQWDRLMGINLTGCFLCSRAVLPEMIRQHRGAILNISSMWGQTGASCEVAYSASKAGVIGFTRALAQEVGPSGIRVNCIAPGVIDTQMNGEHSPETMAALAEETPLSRIGTPQEVAQAAWFLCSPQASFITGQVLGVNGGFVV